jgi:neutral/alkaline ceramidase-like enzyme
LLAAAALWGAGFRASAVKVDITPQSPQWLMGYAARQSTGVHDKIYHRVVAMDSGDTQFYLVSSDLCLFSPAFYDEVARDLQKETGIQPKQFWWGVTHTHAAPEVGPPSIYKELLGRSDHEWDREYAGRIKSALIEAVKAARAKLEPARIGFGQGIAMANINRRAKDVDGTVSLGLNPDGPADRQLGVIRLERPDGSPIALVVNYAMHGTVLGGKNTLISGDGPGTVSAYLEQKIGATVLYMNGAAGNMAPIYSVYDNPKSGHLSQFNVLLGDRVLTTLRSMGPAVGDVSVWLGEKFAETPRKAGLSWPEDMGSYARVEGGRALVRLPLRFLRINDTVIWAAPVEMLCEIAIAVREQSPFPRTFYFGYTNGWFGYLPTAKAFEEGGYEPRTSPFTGQAEADVTQTAVACIQGMRQ